MNKYRTLTLLQVASVDFEQKKYLKRGHPSGSHLAYIGGGNHVSHVFYRSQSTLTAPIAYSGGIQLPHSVQQLISAVKDCLIWAAQSTLDFKNIVKVS